MKDQDFSYTKVYLFIAGVGVATTIGLLAIATFIAELY
jgi:hypothetical protein